MKTIKSLDIISTGKTLALFYAITISIYSVVAAFKVNNLLEGFFLVLFASIFATIIGFLIGVITAWAYNLSAKYTGGIKFNVE
jgi:ABC-type sulfate transport system permease component